MSLNKTLGRIFDEIRREARRNPGFADRLDAVLRAHLSRRDVDEELIEEAKAPIPETTAGAPPAVSATTTKRASATTKATAVVPPSVGETLAVPAELNPVGLYQREGAEALLAALVARDRNALLALVAEHNLDPGGEAGELDRDGLAAHVLAQAQRRAERDSKLFDY